MQAFYHLRSSVSELHQALLTQRAVALVGQAGLQEELSQAHGVAPEQGPHGGLDGHALVLWAPEQSAGAAGALGSF